MNSPFSRNNIFTPGIKKLLIRNDKPDFFEYQNLVCSLKKMSAYIKMLNLMISELTSISKRRNLNGHKKCL